MKTSTKLNPSISRNIKNLVEPDLVLPKFVFLAEPESAFWRPDSQ